MKFVLHIDPPTTTAQQRRWTIGGNGKPRSYKGRRVQEAEDKLTAALIPYIPASPAEGAIHLTVRWFFPVKDRKKAGHYKTSRPDTDNLQKLLKDCMTRLGYWKDDAQVASEHVEKFWSADGRIDISIFELTTTEE